MHRLCQQFIWRWPRRLKYTISGETAVLVLENPPFWIGYVGYCIYLHSWIFHISYFSLKPVTFPKKWPIVFWLYFSTHLIHFQTVQYFFSPLRSFSGGWILSWEAKLVGLCFQWRLEKKPKFCCKSPTLSFFCETCLESCKKVALQTLSQLPGDILLHAWRMPWIIKQPAPNNKKLRPRVGNLQYKKHLLHFAITFCFFAMFSRGRLDSTSNTQRSWRGHRER